MRRQTAGRKSGAAAILFVASGGGTVVAHAQSGTEVRVTVNQTPIAFQGQGPLQQNGRVLVPLRGVLERLGAYVQYDPQTKTVVALRGKTTITLPVGSRQALMGDRAVTLDTPAQISGGALLVPLRFVAEALGAQVAFDVPSRTVAIVTTGPAPAGAARAVTGIVLAVYPNVSPRRIVVRVPGDTPEAQKQGRTIPLRSNAAVSVRRPNSLVAITLDRIRAGDTVAVLLSAQGQASAVEVTVRAPEGRPTLPSRLPVGDAATLTFSGEFLEASKIGASRYVLKMTDNRLVEVENDVLVLYNNQKISVDDLRSGDRLSIALDPKTRRGTRVVVAVEP